MNTTDPSKKKRRTTIILLPPEMGESAKRASNNALLRLFRHLNGPISTSSARPSEAQRRLLVTGFILGVLSIVTSFLSFCGFLTSICGLAIGVYARRKLPALHIMAFWTIGLSLIGLVLSLLFILVTISIYL
jgi:hypothetical protein